MLCTDSADFLAMASTILACALAISGVFSSSATPFTGRSSAAPLTCLSSASTRLGSIL
jgi:hypothetical protein